MFFFTGENSYKKKYTEIKDQICQLHANIHTHTHTLDRYFIATNLIS